MGESNAISKAWQQQGFLFLINFLKLKTKKKFCFGGEIIRVLDRKNLKDLWDT